jgi:transposase
MDGKVLGIERRRRWSRDEKARIVEETLAPGAVASEVARRHGVAQSLLFTWRRLARTAVQPNEPDGSILLPVEIDSTGPQPVSEAARPSRPATNGRRPKPGTIEIELGSGSRVRVDNDVDADALRRVLSVLSER